MTTISSKSFTDYNREVRMKKGPLVKVDLGGGRYVKMHEKDAIAAGHIPVAATGPAPETKTKPKPEDKQIKPEGDKATPPQEAKSEADDFTVIDGVGPATARALVANGVTTLDELRDAGELDFLSASVNAAIEEWRNEGGD